MPRYSEERKQAVMAKLLPPYNLTPQQVAEQEGISLATLYKWRRQAAAKGTRPERSCRSAVTQSSHCSRDRSWKALFFGDRCSPQPLVASR